MSAPDGRCKLVAVGGADLPSQVQKVATFIAGKVFLDAGNEVFRHGDRGAARWTLDIAGLEKLRSLGVPFIPGQGGH